MQVAVKMIINYYYCILLTKVSPVFPSILGFFLRFLRNLRIRDCTTFHPSLHLFTYFLFSLQVRFRTLHFSISLNFELHLHFDILNSTIHIFPIFKSSCFSTSHFQYSKFSFENAAKSNKKFRIL